MVFLPGGHTLDRNITVSNVTRLTMHGESSSDSIATIVRNGSVGFSFTNMVNFNTYSLAFTSYNKSWSYSGSNSALFLQSTQNAKLVNCSFHDNLGTALAVNNINITLAGNSKFIRNQCACQSFSEVHELGCGIAALNSTLTFTGNSFFHENTQTNSSSSYCAGAIWASGSSLHFNGTNSFIKNSVNGTKGFGGAIYATDNTSLSFSGTSNFTHNSAEYGGAISTDHNGVLTFYGTNNFVNNSAEYGGAISVYYNGVLTFDGTNNFVNNSAVYGGAIYAGINISLAYIGTSNFSNNTAESSGGAIYTYKDIVLTFNGSNSFSSNSAKYKGGAIYADTNTSLCFNGTSNFSHNSAFDGGAIFLETNSSLCFNGTSDCSHNSADDAGGAIIAENSVILAISGTSSFSRNLAIQGGAISALFNTTLVLDGTISFTNNGHDVDKDEFSYGGALAFFKSTLSLVLNATVRLENNHASFGGAISVFDTCMEEKCFFQLPGQNLSNYINAQLFFKNNSADAAGSVLYGGTIDNCKLTRGLDSYSSGKVFDMLVYIEDDNNYNTASDISSDPLRLCPCDSNSDPDCSKSSKTQSIYPGEMLQISVVAVGQRNGATPAQVRSRTDRGTKLPSSQYTQQTNEICTILNYTVFSKLSLSKLDLSLYADDTCTTFDDNLALWLNINQTCPHGFQINPEENSCVCDEALQQYTNNCNITNGTGRITRESDDTFWVSYNQSHGLTVYPHCPFDYCTNDTVNFTIDNLDPEKQCANDRSNLLCGHCKKGYNMVLGTFQCKPSNQCTNIYLLLLFPFAVMGVALVFLLLACKLTVATGTISGLLFYANIVGVNRTIFLPQESTDVLSIFIAWLNLDFGIETCFYNGMEPYGKTWLQFVFPVYIWAIVGLMILVSRYSQKFANLLGNNPVSVLATLILLSYAKILRTLITVVTFANLEYQDNYTQRVWWYDANVGYLADKHVPLFLVALLVFFFLFLPYTLVLLFGQWLQAISHLRLFSWVNSTRLKPFMDSYHAPCKAKHRYWPGLLLVLRFVLYLVFAFTPKQGANVNLLAILVGAGVIYLWAWASHGVYKNWCLDALEGSFVLNLIVLVGATYYIHIAFLIDPSKSEKNKIANQLAVGYTSVTIALVTFIGILVYHIFQQLRHTKLWKKVPKLNMKIKKLNIKQVEDSMDNFDEDNESGKFDELREPLLDYPPQPTHSVV